MRPADAYRLKYRSASQTIEPNDESNTALIFGGPNELHLAQEMYNIDLSAREGFRNEESDTLFSIDGFDLENRFRRFGERLTEQSERGAAAVVYV